MFVPGVPQSLCQVEGFQSLCRIINLSFLDLMALNDAVIRYIFQVTLTGKVHGCHVYTHICKNFLKVGEGLQLLGKVLEAN